MRVVYEHYRVPERDAPLVPRVGDCYCGTQEGIDQYALRYDAAYRAECLIPPDQREDGGPVYKSGMAPCTYGGKTVCKVLGDDDTVLAVGVAWCSINDVFSYRIGRAIALGRAMKQLQENVAQLGIVYEVARG